MPLGDLFPDADRALTPEGFLHVFPQIYDCEGFFVARLRKMSSLPAMPAPGYKVGRFLLPSKAAKHYTLPVANAVGLLWDENLHLWQREKEVWLFPAEIESLIGKVRFPGSVLSWPKVIIKAIAGNMKRR